MAQWDAMFETNTRGPFLMSKAAYPHLKAARGRIINIGSLGGLHPWPTHGHYCTSKAALHMLTQTMSKAFAPEISVNCVAPGMIVNGEVTEDYEHFAHKTPMKRNGTPEDVAAAVMFFAAGPHFITGSDFECGWWVGALRSFRIRDSDRQIELFAFPPYRKLRDRMGHPVFVLLLQKQILRFAQDDIGDGWVIPCVGLLRGRWRRPVARE